MSGQLDLVVIGGGINGAGIARDAAGRGLSVLLVERRDYAGGTSSNSSKLIHGGLRYLETLQFALVREALHEREVLLHAAPHIMEPMRFLLPLSEDQPRPAWQLRLGLWLYDILAGRRELSGSGRLTPDEAARIPHLRADRFDAVLHYSDVLTDDARLVLETLLDARARGAEIRNYCEATATHTVSDGYRVFLSDHERDWSVRTRYVVNAAGPWANRVRERVNWAGAGRRLRLVRGSHIVLPMPRPPIHDALTLQQGDGRVVFVLPWLSRFLIVGTTEVPQAEPDGETLCSDAERDYLLRAVNAALDLDTGPDSVVWTWSGLRPLVDDHAGDPSRASRSARLDAAANGRGGCVTVYGGKITTYRRLAERVMDTLAGMGAAMGPAWTAAAPLHGGGMSREALARLADSATQVSREVAHRWAFTYGDVARDLLRRVAETPSLGREIAAQVPVVELEHARAVEDARCGEDFLERRTKLRLTLDEQDRSRIVDWFASRANARHHGAKAHEQ